MEADIQEATVGVPNAEEAHSQTGQKSTISDEEIIEGAMALCALSSGNLTFAKIESEGAETSEVYLGPCCNPFYLDLYLYVAYKYQLIPKEDYKRMRSRDFSKFKKNLGKSVILLSYSYRYTFKQNLDKVFSYIRMNLRRHHHLYYCSLFVIYSLRKQPTPFRFLVLLSFISELTLSIYYDQNGGDPYKGYLDKACAFYVGSHMGEIRKRLKETDQFRGLIKWTDILITAWKSMSPVILAERHNVPTEPAPPFMGHWRVDLREILDRDPEEEDEDVEIENLGQFYVPSDEENDIPVNESTENYPYDTNAKCEIEDHPHTVDELTTDDDFKMEDNHPFGGSNQRPLDLTNARAANPTGSSAIVTSLPTESSFPYPMNQFPYSPSSPSGPSDRHVPVQFTGSTSSSYQATKDQLSPRASAIVHTSQHLATKSSLILNDQVQADTSEQDSAKLVAVPVSVDQLPADLPAQDSTEQLPVVLSVSPQEDQVSAYLFATSMKDKLSSDLKTKDSPRNLSGDPADPNTKDQLPADMPASTPKDQIPVCPYASSLRDQLQTDPSTPAPTYQLPSDLSVQDSTEKLPADLPDPTPKDQLPSDPSAQDSTEQISSGLSVLVLEDQLQANPSNVPLREQLSGDFCGPAQKHRLPEGPSSHVPTGESRETTSCPIGESERDEAEAEDSGRTDTNKEQSEETEDGAVGEERPDPEGEDGGSPTKRIWWPRPKKSKKKKSRAKW